MLLAVFWQPHMLCTGFQVKSQEIYKPFTVFAGTVYMSHDLHLFYMEPQNMKKGENHPNCSLKAVFDYLHANYMLFTYSLNFQVLHWQDFLLNCSVSFIRISSENVLSLERQ